MLQYLHIDWYDFQSDNSRGDEAEMDSDATFIFFVCLMPYSCGLDSS